MLPGAGADAGPGSVEVPPLRRRWSAPGTGVVVLAVVALVLAAGTVAAALVAGGDGPSR